MKVYKYWIMLPALLYTIYGCSSSKQIVQEDSDSKQNKTQNVKMDESFEPFKLNDYDLEITKKVEDTGDIDYTFLVAPNADTTARPTELPGYRVQIFSSTDQEEAQAVRKNAILKFEDNVYVVFDNPYYKVRVGDCRSRYEADELQMSAEKKGYPDAWIVRTNVTIVSNKKQQQ